MTTTKNDASDKAADKKADSKVSTMAEPAAKTATGTATGTGTMAGSGKKTEAEKIKPGTVPLSFMCKDINGRTVTIDPARAEWKVKDPNVATSTTGPHGEGIFTPSGVGTTTVLVRDRQTQRPVIHPGEAPVGFPEVLQRKARRLPYQRFQEGGPPSERDIGDADAGDGDHGGDCR